MTSFEIIAYLKYRWQAKGRHGTHSPFVYAFVEEVLRKSSTKELLLKNILQYFHFEEIITYPKTEVKSHFTDAPANKISGQIHNFNQLYILEADPEANHLFFKEHLRQIRPEDVVLIMPLHKSKAHQLVWEEITHDQKVRLSMDLFDMGLLFFRTEFKEKQHFVLKH